MHLKNWTILIDKIPCLENIASSRWTWMHKAGEQKTRNPEQLAHTHASKRMRQGREVEEQKEKKKGWTEIERERERRRERTTVRIGKVVGAATS